ncbi:hypothetical protein FRC17_006479, partial [Serendipita sp. 399]
SQGANKEALLEFMTIAVEEVHRAPRGSNHHIADAVNAAIPSFMDTFGSTVLASTSAETEKLLALKCLQSWIGWGLSGKESDLTSVIPTLISILSTPSLFIATSDALQDILTASAMADGAGVKTITEPLLDWILVTGRTIADSAVAEGTPNPISSSFCRLLCALGDHSNVYIAKRLIKASQASTGGNQGGLEPRIQEFLRLMLLYTGFPGFFGTEEEDSESTLGFWYLLQESLWEAGEEEEEANDISSLINTESIKALQTVIEDVVDGVNNLDYMMDEEGPMKSPIDGESQIKKAETGDRMKMARMLFSEAVTILRRKVTWPTPGQVQEGGGWDAEQREIFTVYVDRSTTILEWRMTLESYRRNVGDTLINACYVLRDQFLTSLLDDMKTQLAQVPQQADNIEAILFCIKAVHDALTSSNLAPLEFLFQDSTMSALPQAGPHRVRHVNLFFFVSSDTSNPHTAEYATYFSAASSSSSLLRAVNYTATALPEPSLSLQASITLKELCDANRATLAPHISSFASLHQNIELLGPEEKSKVLESIASVISALPPAAALDPVQAIVQPLLQGLAKSLDPLLDHEVAHQLCTTQLRSLTGCAKGLTIVSDPLEGKFVPDHAAISQARLDPKMAKLRDDIVLAIRTVTERWWSNAEITGALSELIKAITATVVEESILSLPPQPLLGIIAEANQRQVSSTWLTLATILAGQLQTPKTLESLNPAPTAESIQFIQELSPRVLAPSLDAIRDTTYMEA